MVVFISIPLAGPNSTVSLPKKTKPLNRVEFVAVSSSAESLVRNPLLGVPFGIMDAEERQPTLVIGVGAGRASPEALLIGRGG